jgi:hypothetical protein
VNEGYSIADRETRSNARPPLHLHRTDFHLNANEITSETAGKEEEADTQNDTAGRRGLRLMHACMNSDGEGQSFCREREEGLMMYPPSCALYFWAEEIREE